MNAWILNWDFHQTFHDPFHLFDANIFFPARYALAFSENLYGASLFGFPLYAAGSSTLLVYNVLFLLGMGLSALAAWALAKHVTGDGAAALVAGIVYAFVPWRLAQLPHIQFQWGAFLALALLFLLRYLEGGRRRDAVAFGAFFAWNALCNVHYALFSGLLVLAVAGYEALVAGWGVMRGRLLGTGIAVAAAGLLVLPFYLPYEKASQLYGMKRGVEEIAFFSGRPIDFLTAGPQNKLYGPLTQQWAQPEGDFFPGLSVVVLAMAALAQLRAPRPERSRRDGPDERGRGLLRALDAALAVAAALWIWALARPGLTLGPLSLRDPGRVLVLTLLLAAIRLTVAFPVWSRFRDLPDFLRRRFVDRRAGLILVVALLGAFIALGMHSPFYRTLVLTFGKVFRSIRVPSRGITLFDLGLGVLAAWGLSLWTRRMSRAGRLVALCGALAVVTFEYRAFPIEVGDVDVETPAVYRWLARAPFQGAIVEWPFGFDPDIEHTYRAAAHWKPILNGYSGFGPPHYHELGAILQERPIPPRAWDRMEELGAAVLVFHPDEEVDREKRLRWVQGLREGIRTGRAVPLAFFPGTVSGEYAFRLAGARPFETGLPEATLEGSAAEVLRRLARLENLLRPPFGWVDLPREGELVDAGTAGVGWALDDSGVREVRLTADGSVPVPLSFGGRHPGVIPAYPGYPGLDKAGFSFQVPELAPGPHTLEFTIFAVDGGRTALTRKIVVR